MKYKLSKEESLILRLFVEREVPDFICEIVIDNINLSEHYEELFNYGAVSVLFLIVTRKYMCRTQCSEQI